MNNEKMRVSVKEPICTMCGKELDEFDLDARFQVQHYIGFGSVYDLNILEARLCCKCFDKILNTILPMFKYDPLYAYDIVSEDGKLIAKRIEGEW
jgi:hypothetical protein